MRVNLYVPLTDTYHHDISFDNAVSICARLWALYGDTKVVIINSSTNEHVTKFKLSNSKKWYTIEELVDLSPYYTHFNIVAMQ